MGLRDLLPRAELEIEHHDDGTTSRTLEVSWGRYHAFLARWRGSVARQISAQVLDNPQDLEAHVSAFGYVAQVVVDRRERSFGDQKRRWELRLDWAMGPDILAFWSLGAPDEPLERCAPADRPPRWQRGHLNLRDIFGRRQIQQTILAAGVVELDLPEGRRRVVINWIRIRHVRPFQPALLEPDWVILQVHRHDKRPIWWPSRRGDDGTLEDVSIPLNVDPNTFLPNVTAAVDHLQATILADRQRHGGNIHPPLDIHLN